MSNVTTSQGTVKVVNPQTNGTTRYEKLVNNIEVTQKALDLLPPWAFQKEEQYKNDIAEYKKELGLLSEDTLHAVDEASKLDKQAFCEMCVRGVDVEKEEICDCCNGDYQDCRNCKPEGTGNDTADLLASTR